MTLFASCLRTFGFGRDILLRLRFETLILAVFLREKSPLIRFGSFSYISRTETKLLCFRISKNDWVRNQKRDKFTGKR